MKFLNPKNPVEGVALLRKFMGTGFAQVPPEVVRNKIIEASEKSMKKEIKEAVKHKKSLTADDLTKSLVENPEFLKLCEELGLTLDFFKGMADNILQGELKQWT